MEYKPEVILKIFIGQDESNQSIRTELAEH